ncbi:MAG: hypothetical protein ACK5IN_10305 [Microbacterium sp.]|uniref:hypothetical protein n=1 Tax=Microbacterium sp. TaxID=51671 RepID=UPI003A8C5D10
MKRGAVVGIVVGALVVVLAGTGLTWWLLRGETAEQAAQRYVQALESGDRDTLAGFLSGDADRDRLLDLFDGASGHIADVTVSPPADDLSFRAEVTLDGQPGVIGFVLAEGAAGWHLAADYLATVDIASTLGDSARLGEVMVPLGQTAMLPALYPIAPAPVELLEGGVTVPVTNESPVRIDLDAMLRPEATAIAQEQVDAYAAACAQPATAVPPNCGLRVPWGADLTSLEGLAFRVEQTPQVSLLPDASEFAATGGVIVATARGTTWRGEAGAFTYRADDWALYGSMSFDGDRLVLAVR